MLNDFLEEIVVQEEGSGERLDAYLARLLADQFSRTKLKKMIEDGKIRVDGRQVAAHHPVKEGEKIEIENVKAEASESRAEDIPLDVVYEDEDLIVINKPAGIVVHPAVGNPNHTLVNALLYHTRNLSGAGGAIRPGIVHRLDKDTSGLLVIAKNDRTHAALGEQFKKHTIERSYDAIVRGVVQHDEGMCEEPVGRAFLNRKKVMVRPSGGKEALTYFKVAKRFKKASHLKVFPKTGRTHQIRVHMAHIGHPVLGDTLYGVISPWINRQALHAASLGIIHPRTKKSLSFKAPIPQDMQFLLSQLESQV